MSTSSQPPSSTPEIFFASFPITHQVFHTSRTGLSHALVNLRPLLPGHSLVIPHRTSARNLEDLSAEERADLMNTVVRVQRVLRRAYSSSGDEAGGGERGGGDGGAEAEAEAEVEATKGPETGRTSVGAGHVAGGLQRKQARRPPGKITAFNVAMQDGPASGQSVPHVHMHIIPRREGDMDAHGGFDVLYEWLEEESWSLDRNWNDAIAEETSGREGGREDGDAKEQRRGNKSANEDEGKLRKTRKDGFTPEADRKNRSMADMRAEAEWLSREMARDEQMEEEGLIPRL